MTSPYSGAEMVKSLKTKVQPKEAALPNNEPNVQSYATGVVYFGFSCRAQ